MSIASPEGSLCSSSGSQPSPASNVVSPVANVVLNPLSLGFSAASLMQPAVTSAENASVVNNFQSVLQQTVQQAQQVETKPVVSLIKSATELLNQSMDSINKPPVTNTFPTLPMQAENKPAVSNAIPLDLQFPTGDLPTTEAGSIVATTVANPFQSNVTQLNCVSIPQLIGDINMNGTIATTATSPPVLAATVSVSDAQQQATVTSPNSVVITTVSPPAQVTTQALTVADCLGQAIIKAEPTPVNNEISLAIANNVVTVPSTTGAPAVTGTTTQVAMGLLGGSELQPHQGTIANALSQMSDNELINYINPNCFEGALL